MWARYEWCYTELLFFCHTVHVTDHIFLSFKHFYPCFVVCSFHLAESSQARIADLSQNYSMFIRVKLNKKRATEKSTK